VKGKVEKESKGGQKRETEQKTKKKKKVDRVVKGHQLSRVRRGAYGRTTPLKKGRAP